MANEKKKKRHLDKVQRIYESYINNTQDIHGCTGHLGTKLLVSISLLISITNV